MRDQESSLPPHLPFFIRERGDLKFKFFDEKDETVRLKMMRCLLFLLLLLVLSVNAIDVVIPLTQNTFQDYVNSNKYVLVEFYAPWCGFCKKFASTYQDVATTIFEENTNARIAKVDSISETALARKYEVKSYPTLLWFVNGVPFNKESLYIPQTKEELVRFVRKMSQDRVTLLESEEEAHNFIHNVMHATGKFRGFNRYSVSPMIGTFADAKSQYAETFKSACERMELNMDVLCAMMISPTQIDARPKIVLHRVRYQDDTHSFEGFGNTVSEEHMRGNCSKGFIQWSHVHLYPGLKFSEKTQIKIYQSGVTRQILLFVEHKDSNRDSIFSQVSKFAETHRGEYLVIEVPTSETRITNFFNVRKFPAVRPCRVCFLYIIIQTKTNSIQVRLVDSSLSGGELRK